MRATISSQGYELTPALKRYTLENLRDSLERIWDKDGSQLEIHLRDLRGPKGGIDKECRVIFHMAAGPKLVITEVTEDMRKSIHQARRRLLRRARKHIEERTQNARRHRKHYLADVLPKDLIGRRMPRSRDVPHARETHG